MRKTLISSLMGASILATLAIAEPAQAALIYSNTFETGAGSYACSFTCSITTTGAAQILTSPSGARYLGYLGMGNSATLTITGINTNLPHTMITLGFSLYVIGSMDGSANAGGGPGDNFTIGESGSNTSQIFNYNFANYGGGNTQNYKVAGSAPGANASTINTLGYTGFPTDGNTNIQDSEYQFKAGALGAYTFADSGNTLSITFTGLSNEALDNEYYGIDNLVINTNAMPGGGGPISANVPEPAPVLLMGIGLAAFIFGKRRRR